MYVRILHCCEHVVPCFTTASKRLLLADGTRHTSSPQHAPLRVRIRSTSNMQVVAPCLHKGMRKIGPDGTTCVFGHSAEEGTACAIRRALVTTRDGRRLRPACTGAVSVFRVFMERRIFPSLTLARMQRGYERQSALTNNEKVRPSSKLLPVVAR